MTDAHDQRLTLHLMTHVPEHLPREADPHYGIFIRARARMKSLGLLKCNIPDCTFGGPVELHHDKVEFSLQGGVDMAKFNRAYGLHLHDDEEFKAYIEGPGNLEPLCVPHHRSYLGVHSLPTPFWNALRVWKDDLAPPAEVVSASEFAKQVSASPDASAGGDPHD